MVNAVVGRLIKNDDVAVQSLIDPVGKFRVSNPMNLIDTDFEMGRQTTRWQDLELVNNIPTFFARDNDESLNISSIRVYEGSTNVLVTCEDEHGLSPGTPIFVQGVNSYSAEGGFIVASTPSTTTFYYKANYEQTSTGDIFDQYSTYIWKAQFYQGTAYTLDTLTSITTDNGFPTSKITVDTGYPHGFSINSAFVLARSVGTKALAIDAGLVDVDDVVQTSVVYDPTATVSSGIAGKHVTPYDWVGNVTYYFEPSTVSSSFVTVDGHVLSDGDLVLYHTPAGDTACSGLESFDLYQVVNSTTSQFQLGTPTASLNQAYTYYSYYNGQYGHGTVLNLWVGSITNATAVDLSSFPNWHYMDYYRYYYGYNYPTHAYLYATINGTDYLLAASGYRYSWNYFSYWGRAFFTLPATGTLTKIWVRAYTYYGYPFMLFGWPSANHTIYITSRADSTPLTITGSGATTTYGQHMLSRAYPVDRAYTDYVFIIGSTSTFNNIPTYIFSSSQLEGLIPLVNVNYSDLPNVTGFPGFTNYGGLWSTSYGNYSQHPLGRSTLYCQYTFSTGGRGYESDFALSGDIDMRVSIRPHTSFVQYHALSLIREGYNNYWQPGSARYGRIGAHVYTNGTTGYLYLNGESSSSNINWTTSVATQWYTLRVQHNTTNGTVTATVYQGEDTIAGTVVATTSISEYYSGTYKLGLGGSSNTTTVNYSAFFYKFRSNNIGSLASLNNYSDHYAINGTATTSGQQVYKRTSSKFFAVDTLNQVVAAVPATTLTERNSFYIPDTVYQNNGEITLVPDESAELPEPLVANVTYYTEKVTGNRFRLRLVPDGEAVDLYSHGVGNVTIVGTSLNPTRNSVYSLGHGLADGTELGYNADGETVIGGLSNGSTYYTYNSTSDYFRLSNTPIPSAITYTIVYNSATSVYDIRQGLDRTIYVTVENDGSGNAFYLDGVKRVALTLYKNYTYTFDQSSTSTIGHPLRFSTTSDGTHGGGSEYTTGVTVVGTPGSSGSSVILATTDSTPNTLYYYCSNHSAMGGTVSVQTAPDPALYRGVQYTFDQSDSTNTNAQLSFSEDFQIIKSTGKTDSGGFQVGYPLTKDMYYSSLTFQSYMLPGSSAVTISGNYWSDWGNNVFDNWGYFYLYSPSNGVYTMFNLNQVNQADGVLATQTVSDNGRTFTITHGYSVQGVYKYSIEVDDNDSFVFGMGGYMGAGGYRVSYAYSRAITVGGESRNMYYEDAYDYRYASAERIRIYFCPYVAQSWNSRPYSRWVSTSSVFLYTNPVKRGITIYFAKYYDVYQWIQYDLDTNASAAQYTDGVATVGTPGFSGAQTTFNVQDSTPDSLVYTIGQSTGTLQVVNAEIDLTSVGTGTQYFNVNVVGASDGTYFTSSVPSPTTLVLDAPYNIPNRTFTCPPANVSTVTNSIFLPDHRIPTGASIRYDSNGDESIGGLDTVSEYYVIRVDQHTIQLAASRQNALAEVPLSFTSVTANTTPQIFETSSIAGELVSDATANIQQDSDIIIGNGTSFTNTFKIGDVFKIVQNGATISKRIVSVLSNTKIQVDSGYSLTANNVSYLLTTGLFVKADGLSLHRAFDGGIELVASTNADAQVMRQTRKYFRYQSGKGIQCSLAVNFSAPTQILSLSRVGLVARVETARPHRLTSGLEVVIEETDDAAWHGPYTITVVDSLTFTYNLVIEPVSTQAGGIPSFYVKAWSNSHLRCGLFDDQNGIFWEYDGQALYACRRSSVRQITGTAAVTFNSPVVTGTKTTFTTALAVRDSVVIKGQTYRVVNIQNDTLMYVQPVYRGNSQSNVVITKTETTKVAQPDFSIDPVDGTGPTGYRLDINRIQMVYIDYSWYGAGKVRFGFKSTLGEVRYVHEFVHNNHNTEAYMRSGNLPCRYEIENTGVPTYVPSLLHWGTSVLMDGLFHDDKAYLFTASGQVLSYNNGDNSRTFTATSDSRVTGYIRINGRWRYTTYWPTYDVYNPSTQKTESAYLIIGTSYSAIQDLRSGTGVSNQYLQSDTTIVTIENQGGSAYVYINKSPTQEFTSQTINVGTVSVGSDILPVIPLISIRLAPSADNSRPGLLGDREVVNRMMMTLKNCGVLTTNDTEIRLMLNSSIDNRSWQRSTAPSLSQLVVHEKGDLIEGGTQIFNFRAAGGQKDISGVRNATSSEFELSELVDLGNSIIGGDDIFPNGPDVLTIAAAVIDTTGINSTNPYVITARITWSESQA